MSEIQASGDINTVYEQIDEIVLRIIEQKKKKAMIKRAQVQAQIIRDEEKAERLKLAQQENEKVATEPEKSLEEDKSHA